MSDLTWDEYVSEAVKTAPDQSAEMQLVQAALGLVGESQELHRADSAADELGDCYWYTALAYDALDPDHEHFQHVASDVVPAIGLTKAAAALCEEVESRVFQGDCNRDAVCRHLAACYTALQYSHAHLDHADIWAANVDKLRDRHGDSWRPAEEQKRG